MVHAQNYVFYFESDIAKVFPFRPTCSSYDSEIKSKVKSQKVSQKGPEKEVNKCGKLGLTAWDPRWISVPDFFRSNLRSLLLFAHATDFCRTNGCAHQRE